MDTTLKKRNRIPSSCSVCRKRKSKCDRVKPICGSCRKKSIAHLCFYENEKPSEGDDVGTKVIAGQYPHPDGHPHGQIVPPDQHQQQPPPPHPQAHSYPYPHPHQSPGSVPQQVQNQPGHRVSTPSYYYPGISPPDPAAPPEMAYTNTPPNVMTPGMNYHPMAPPPPIVGPNNVPMMAPQIPPINYYEDPNGYRQHPNPPRHSVSSADVYGPPPAGVSPASNPVSSSSSRTHSQRGSVQLPPIKTPTTEPDGTITASIGPNSSLKINTNDRIESFFSNASFPLSLEGAHLQHHGQLTFVGLNKSDRFVKFFRKFAIDLLRKGGISEFVIKKKRKKTSNEGSPLSKKTKSSMSTPMNSAVSAPSVSHNGATPESPGDIKSEMNGAKTTAGSPLASLAVDNSGSRSSDVSESVNGSGERKSESKNEFFRSATANGSVREGGAEKLEEAEEEIGDDEEDDGEDGDDDEYDDADDRKEVDDEDDILLMSGIKITKEDKENVKHKAKRTPLSVLPGLKALYSGTHARKEYYKIVEQAVLEIFPQKKTALSLFSRYFKWVHPFIPIISEQSLILDVNQVVDTFPSFADGKYEAFNIRNDKHLNIVGIMLVIMRLGYLSLIHNLKVHNKYGAFENGMIKECRAVNSKTFADVVNLCLPDEHTSPRSSVRMIQLLTLIHFYREVLPSDCHGVGAADSQILFGDIIRHAFSIGLNRDPTMFREHETISSNEELVRTWRALWNYLAVKDASTSIHRASVLNIYSTEVSDVKPSFPEKADEDFISTHNTILEISKSYRKLSKMLSNFQKNPKVSEILVETNKLEHIFFRFFGKDFFKDFICKPAREGDFTVESKEHQESYLKVIKYVVFISLRANLSTMYYIIAMNYEKKYNEDKSTSMSSGVELFKIHFKSVVQLVYIMSYVFDNSVDLFGKNYDYILTAANERYMIKIHGFLTSFFIRLIHQKQLLSFKSFDPKATERLAAINRLFNMVLVEAELFVGNFRQLSLRYVNSYKIYVLTYYVMKQCMENPEVFFKYALSDISMILETTNILQYFTADEINYLCKLTEEFRFAKESSQKQRKKQENNKATQQGNVAEKEAPEETKEKKRGFFESISISSLNPMKNFVGNVFKMNGSNAAAMMKESQAIEAKKLEEANLFEEPNGEEEDFTSDDFLKFFELYGSTSNPHLE